MTARMAEAAGIIEVRARRTKDRKGWWWGIYRGGRLVRRCPPATEPVGGFAGAMQEAIDAFHEVETYVEGERDAASPDPEDS